jgi:hypothetical protein
MAVALAKAYEQRHCPPTTSPHQPSRPTGPLCPYDPPAVTAALGPSPSAQLALAQALNTPEPTPPR